jgi:hypothetical protein
MLSGQITTPAKHGVASQEGNRSSSERFESCFAGFFRAASLAAVGLLPTGLFDGNYLLDAGR